MLVKEAKKIQFAKAYADLQKIVAWFEKDDVDLEEGIKKYEEGLEIVKDLKSYLQTMEIKIKELKELSE